jgi:cytochrome c biogenesis protein CcmG, thiol:disulfide interchange protein DsbE
MPEHDSGATTSYLPPDAQVDASPHCSSVPARGERTRLLRNVATAIVFAVVAGILVWFFAFPSAGAASSQAITLTTLASGPPPRVGKPAPDFRTFGLDGSPVELSAYRGHPVWLTFWATWCPPCRAEAPDIQAASERYKDQGLVILAVNVGEDPATVRDFVHSLGLTFTIASDETTEVAALYRANGLPAHFFIDSAGVLRDVRSGGIGLKTIEQELTKIVMEPVPAPFNP